MSARQATVLLKEIQRVGVNERMSPDFELPVKPSNLGISRERVIRRRQISEPWDKSDTDTAVSRKIGLQKRKRYYEFTSG